MADDKALRSEIHQEIWEYLLVMTSQYGAWAMLEGLLYL